MTARIMRKHTAKRRALARRPSPIRITSPQREVADRLYTTAPVLIIAQRAELCQFLPAAQLKSRLVILDKAAPGCYIDVSKNGCQCKWRSSLVDFSSVEIAAYRSGGRLFLMSEGRYDQRRKTDEHQRIWKHICICDHIAHPLFREVDNLPSLPTHPAYHAVRPLSISVGSAALLGGVFHPLRKI